MQTSRMLLRLFPLLTLCATSACAIDLTKHRVAVGDYCRIAKPITYNSTLDSGKTVQQIEAHNSIWVCVCEGDCPKNESK